MISSNRVEEIYRATLLHMEGGYDYFLYNGRLKKQPTGEDKQFSILADRLRTEAIAEAFFASMIVSNMSAASFNTYSVFYARKDIWEMFINWKSYVSNLETHFSNYVKTKKELKKLIDVDILIERYINDEVPIEFVGLLAYNSKNFNAGVDATQDPIRIAIKDIAFRYYEFLTKKSIIDVKLARILEKLQ